MQLNAMRSHSGKIALEPRPFLPPELRCQPSDENKNNNNNNATTSIFPRQMPTQWQEEPSQSLQRASCDRRVASKGWRRFLLTSVRPHLRAAK